MKYLTAEQIKRIHQRMLAEAGGPDGVRDEGAIESAIENAKQTAFGEDLYPDLIAKTATTTYSLVKNHPFIDGNKRVGFMAMMLMIYLNGKTLKATHEEMVEIILAIAANEKSRLELDEWLRQRVR